MKFTEYVTAIKREVMDALQGIFDDSYPDEALRNRVKVTLDFPMEEQQYPSIHLTYNETAVRNIGLAHYELDDNGNKVYTWWFEGALTFNIQALSTIDRDMLAAGIVNLFAFVDAPEYSNFHDDLEDGDWVVLHVGTDSLAPGGYAVSPSPWSDEQNIYATAYTVAVAGELYSDPITADLISIAEVRGYPYIQGDPVPSGADDPAPWE